MGIELDVLVGHPEHELLFLATQVAKAAGLKNPYVAVGNYKRLQCNEGNQWMTLGSAGITLQLKRREVVQAMPHTTVLLAEHHVYQMLLRGKAPQSEPFRRWVTEEVLPTLRKTGKYDAEQSTNPIALGLMDELKALRGASVREKQGARWVLALLRERRSVAVNLKIP
jgi:prophage antirepressor-like protein